MRPRAKNRSIGWTSWVGAGNWASVKEGEGTNQEATMSTTGQEVCSGKEVTRMCGPQS